MSAEPRDPHLLAALRHAPDHDAAPPPELTARILAAAREAARAPERSGSALQRCTAWLTRPQVGAAFATFAVAVLVGVMWSSQEPPLPASESPEMSRDQSSSAPQEAGRVEPAASPPAPAAPAAAAAPPAPRAPVTSERRLAKKGTDRVLEAPAKVSNEATANDAAKVAAPPAPPGARSESSSAPMGALPQRRVGPSMLAGHAAAFDPLLALDAAGNSSVWFWQAPGFGERAHGDAQRTLWSALRTATQGRWEAVPPIQPLAPWLVLRAPNRVGAVLWLSDGGLYLSDADGRTWRAPITPEQARDWQQAVARW